MCFFLCSCGFLCTLERGEGTVSTLLFFSTKMPLVYVERDKKRAAVDRQSIGSPPALATRAQESVEWLHST